MLGAITLNSSFILYLCVYLPQIIHNRTASHLVNLSASMHTILYIGYLLDVFYGFSQQLPWQYKTVSIVGLGLLVIQHLQITQHLEQQKKHLLVSINVFGVLATAAILLYFFTTMQATFSKETTLVIGYISRGCFLLYTLPQILKNHALKLANTISIRFVYLNLLVSILDMMSAWCLNWGWPNKLAAPFTVTLMLILLAQKKIYGPFQVSNDSPPHHVHG